MKLFIVLILSLALCSFTSSQEAPPGGFQPVQWDPNNQALSNLLHTSMNLAMSMQSAGGNLPTGAWNLTEVNYIGLQVVIGTYYEFSVDIQNTSGQKVELDWTIYDDPSDNSINLISSQVIPLS